jgi:hypothetical protein
LSAADTTINSWTFPTDRPCPTRRDEEHEEIGFVRGDEPDLHRLYRFWQWDKPGMWGAFELAYASHMGAHV